MAQAELPDTEQILNFIELCRDEHIAPYPVGTRVISECRGLSMYRVRFGVEHLLRDGGRPAKMPAYPDHSVVLP